MKNGLTSERASGLLLHPTSLPGPFGCGDLGPSAHRFVKQLARARQSYWQMLPVCPVGAGNAPYSSRSSFAGSLLMVSPEALARDGLLNLRRLRELPALPVRRVDYPKTERMREALLREAYAAFRLRASRTDRSRFQTFKQKQRAWLEDHALFMALRRAHEGAPWPRWEKGLRLREPKALARAREAHADEVEFHAFVQHQFDRQWRALREAARAHNVRLIGDLPFYVEHDSADVWAHRNVFELDSRGRARAVAGVAPDLFSAEGQLWGNPLFDWKALARQRYRWWIERLQRSLALFDIVRLDHFIAFHRAWAVPARARTARRGTYRPGPGAKLFTVLRSRLGGLPFIAEDLGTMVPAVHALRDRFSLPGMHVLQFSFSSDGGVDGRPFTCPKRAVMYTGTHDNNTAVGWFRDSGGPPGTRTTAQIARERANLLRYLGTNGREIHWDLIRLALRNVANTAIVPLQDVLGLGASARMNTPGTVQGNWEWRFQEGQLTDRALRRLAELTKTYGRTSESHA